MTPISKALSPCGSIVWAQHLWERAAAVPHVSAMAVLRVLVTPRGYNATTAYPLSRQTRERVGVSGCKGNAEMRSEPA